jgi:hypothetical protein
MGGADIIHVSAATGTRNCASTHICSQVKKITTATTNQLTAHVT